MDPSSDRERISSGQNSDLRLGNANRAARPEVGWPSARQPEHTAILASVQLYDPASGSFSPAGSMAHSRVFQTATLLNNGQVLVAAGFGSAGASTSADLFLPATQTPPGLTAVSVAPATPVSSIVAGATTLRFIATDQNGNQLASVQWTATPANVATLSNDAGNSGKAYVVRTRPPTVNVFLQGKTLNCGSVTLTVQ